MRRMMLMDGPVIVFFIQDQTENATLSIIKPYSVRAKTYLRRIWGYFLSCSNFRSNVMFIDWKEFTFISFMKINILQEKSNFFIRLKKQCLLILLKFPIIWELLLLIIAPQCSSLGFILKWFSHRKKFKQIKKLMPRKKRRIILDNKKNIVNFHKKSRIKNLERGFASWSNRDNNRANWIFSIKKVLLIEKWTCVRIKKIWKERIEKNSKYVHFLCDK